jgi:signal transduction histidine kinase
VVDDHGGRVDVSSEPGAATTVTIEIDERREDPSAFR